MKSERIEEWLDGQSFVFFGRERSVALKKKICVSCGNVVEDKCFKDRISYNEYSISGLCQSCQDDVFGGE